MDGADRSRRRRRAAPLDVRNSESVPPAQRALLDTAILASEDQPFDAMERAFYEAGARLLGAREQGGSLEWEYPLSPQLLVHAHGWQRADGSRLLAAKGAPEAIARICRLAELEVHRLTEMANTMAADGLRVLGVARAELQQALFPEQIEQVRFTWLGLVGLADPVRPTVSAAIAQAREAGIRVVMITGDYPVTAQAIAREIDLDGAHQPCTGAEMEHLSDAGLGERVRNTNVFARVMPQQKLRLVEALKANGEVVAMTGDGVNDAPALRAAHIGIAMGSRGTDVAREAASLVLLDDDFESIVRAVRMGRRIYDNIRDAASYLVAVHVPTVGLALLAVLVGWPLVLLPVHVVFLEFVIDPACSIAFEAEPEAAHVMKRPPRSPKARLFSRATVTSAVLQGLSILAAAAALFAWQMHAGAGENSARAAAFLTLALGNIVKATRFGYVVRAQHGTRPLSFDEQREHYRETVVELSEPRFQFMNTLFELSRANLMAQLVELHDAQALPGVSGYADLYTKVDAALSETHMTGVLKADIVADPDRYVEPDPELVPTLLDQRDAGKQLLLITNSDWSYTRHMMAWTIDPHCPPGTTWRDLFDLVIVSAGTGHGKADELISQ